MTILRVGKGWDRRASLRTPLRAGVPFGAVLWALAMLMRPVPACAQPAQPAPDLAACAAANRQSWTELSRDHDSGVKHHAMHPMVVTRLQGLGSQLARLRDAANRLPRKLADCEQTSQALAGAREQLDRIVGSPAQLSECTGANQRRYGELQASLQVLQVRVTAPTPALHSAASRLDGMRPVLTSESQTLADCRQLSAELADEAAQLQRLAPADVADAALARSGGPVASAPAAAAPSPAACREVQVRTYNEVARQYAQVVGGGPIAAEWVAPLQSLSERLTRLHASIADASAPGWDCDTVARALEQARSELAQLVRR